MALIEEWDSDGSMNWEDFFGTSTEDLVPSLLGMYDALVGRTPLPSCNGDSEIPNLPVPNNHPLIECTKERDKKQPLSNCRCLNKSVSEVVTKCAACHVEPEIRSTDIRDSRILTEEFRCELITCPAGYSPLPNRLKPSATPPPSRSPLSLKRLNHPDILCVPRPLSVSSIASSSSSSTTSSGASSCTGLRRFGIKQSAYLASIESLEDDSGNERGVTSRSERFKCNGSQGSEDSGVQSPCSCISAPSLPPTRPRYCNPHLSYMDRVVMEIIETEQIYVRDLEQIIEGYYKKWKFQEDFPLQERLDDLFNNIKDIYHFNKNFLYELEQCHLDPVKVAGCFVRNNCGFSIYTEYCTNYPRTVCILTELMRQEGTVRLFRERQMALQHTLPLGSYLLKPVQRILKYHLLLQNIVKHYVGESNGYKEIIAGLSTMTGIAQHINDMKRRHEHAVRVQEIQSLLYGWEGEDLTTYGELCAEGAFRISGAKALRHVFLFDKMLLITKKKEQGILLYKTHIECSNLMLIESVPGEPLSFHVIPFDNPRCQYTLHARNLEQKREWTLQLKRVILENYEAVIPLHARQLVMELGQNRTEDEIMADKISPKKQHSAPEYLEKRKHQDRRKSESGLRSRFRRSRKSDVGSNIDSQLDKKPGTPRPQSRLSQDLFSSNPIKSMTWRRKSEPGIYSSIHRDSNSNGFTLTPIQNQLSTSLKEEISSPKNETNNEEISKTENMKTIEEIVGQLLMQNKEFEKMLKKQKQISFRSKNNKCKSERKTETTDEEDEGIYETLVNLKKALESSRIGQKTEQSGNEESEEEDYVTLVCRSNEDLIVKNENKANTIRRTRSFTSSNTEALKVFASLSRIPLDGTNIPTSPAEWLKHCQDLAVPNKKAGSLPRSFQISPETFAKDDPKFLLKLVDRPITIASDKPSARMYEERFENSLQSTFQEGGDITEDESLPETTPGASLDHIHIHPDHKIYKSNVTATMIKNVILSIGHKLAGLKEHNVIHTAERRPSRVVDLLTKQYYKTVKGRRSERNLSDLERPTPMGSPLPVYKQGSCHLGERIANGSAKQPFRPSKKAAALLGIRPDSVLSLDSTFTSSSDGGATEIVVLSGDGERSVSLLVDQDFLDDKMSCKSDESEGSADSFYERTFEAIDDEIFRDSAVYSDTEDKVTESPPKEPPPVPAKPKKLLDNIKLESREFVRNIEGITKSVRERRRELENWRLRQGNEVEEANSQSLNQKVEEKVASKPKGWVKQVVGKIQGEAG